MEKLKNSEKLKMDASVMTMTANARQSYRQAESLSKTGELGEANFEKDKMKRLVGIHEQMKKHLSPLDKSRMWFDKNKGLLAVTGFPPAVLAGAGYLGAYLGTKGSEITSKLGLSSEVSCKAVKSDGSQECTLSFNIDAPAGEVPTVSQLGEMANQLREAGIESNGTVSMEVTEQAAQTVLQRWGIDVWNHMRDIDGWENIGPYEYSDTHTYSMQIQGDSIEIYGKASDERGVNGLGQADIGNEMLAENRSENVADAFQDVSGLENPTISITYNEGVLTSEEIESGIQFLSDSGISVSQEDLAEAIRAIDSGDKTFTDFGDGFDTWYEQFIASERGASVSLDFVVPPQMIDSSGPGPDGFTDTANFYSGLEMVTVAGVSLVALVAGAVIYDLKKGNKFKSGKITQSDKQKINQKTMEIARHLKSRGKLSENASDELFTTLNEISY